MNELMIILMLVYVLPSILSVIVFYHDKESVNVKDFIEIVIISLIPALNIISGYAGGIITISKSRLVNDFLNKKLK